MTTLILDQFIYQPLRKRFLWNTLTGLGWAFWIYLWAPLLRALVVLLSGTHPEGSASAAEQSIQTLLATLAAHATTVMALVGVFFVWALLQWRNNSNQRPALLEQAIPLDRMARSVRLSERDLASCQRAQRMVVTHDDDRGWIRRVDVLADSPAMASRQAA
jgi:poly-beta-1,6-N-acetyl-D-glucosamine biosynthesis protein PgaD